MTPTSRSLSRASGTSTGVFLSALGGVQTPPPSSEPLPTRTAAPDPHPFQNEHEVMLHPQFAAAGDVLIICREGEKDIGFRVHGTVLRASSGVFVQELLKPKVAARGVIFSPDTPAAMHAILRFLYMGHPQHPEFVPTLADCLSVLGFVANYQVPPSLITFLHHVIDKDAVRLASMHVPRTVDIINLLRIAHRFRSERLWAAVLARGWEVVSDPWDMEADIVERAGFALWSILLLVARTAQLGGGAVKVTYPNSSPQVAVTTADGHTILHSYN